MAKQLTVELVREYPGRDGYFYADLALPAAAHEIRDALQKTRQYYAASIRVHAAEYCLVFRTTLRAIGREQPSDASLPHTAETPELSPAPETS